MKTRSIGEPFIRPAYGKALIRCSDRNCDWHGYETQLRKAERKSRGIDVTLNVCPKCGCDSYFFCTEKEIKAIGVPKVCSCASNGIDYCRQHSSGYPRDSVRGS